MTKKEKEYQKDKILLYLYRAIIIIGLMVMLFYYISFIKVSFPIITASTNGIDLIIQILVIYFLFVSFIAFILAFCSVFEIDNNFTAILTEFFTHAFAWLFFVVGIFGIYLSIVAKEWTYLLFSIFFMSMSIYMLIHDYHNKKN